MGVYKRSAGLVLVEVEDLAEELKDDEGCEELNERPANGFAKRLAGELCLTTEEQAKE
jgi:hypothetical protein